MALAVLALGVAATWVVLDEDAYRAPRAAPVAPRPSGDAAVLVHRFAEAIRDGDASTARSLGADRAAAALLSAVVNNARALRVTDFSARYVDARGAATSAGTWSAAVELSWRFARYDRRLATTEVNLGFETAGDQLLITSIGGGDRPTPLWLAGSVEVARTDRVLVLASHGSGGDEAEAPRSDPQRVARRTLRQAGRGLDEVARVLPRWQGPVVVQVPASSRQLDDALAAADGTHEQIAAVTSPVDGSSDSGSPTHVFVNPDVSGSLGRQGAQVVITHELVHIATDATRRRLPHWLLEGFADYVALRNVDLPLEVSAGRLLRDVRRDGVPRRLPSAADFAPDAPGLQAAYEGAWLACLLVADRLGERGLVALYRTVAGGVGLQEALAGADWSHKELLRAWRDRLRELSR